MLVLQSRGFAKKKQLKKSVITIRVRNSANPCVRDMPKSLRTCQMSVHGYPADMSIFCNLKLGLLKLQKDTPQADIDQDNVYLASRVLLLGDNMRLSETSGKQSGRLWTPFSQSFSVSWTQILQQLKLASMLNVGHVSQS